MADDEDLEYTLLNKRDVMVYQIPPASSSSGHKADDWKKCIWRGRCRIAGKGADLTIKMIDGGSGDLFAQCVIPNGEYEKYVERTIDSSRYFVLKITNGARHAFIGLGFEDRNDAFDFNCTLSDFKSTWVDKEKQVEELPKETGPAKDLSLKEGQKITINIAGLGGGRKREQKAAEGGGDGGFAGLLAPPPPGGQSRRQQAAGGAAAPAPILQPPPGQAVAPAMSAAPVPQMQAPAAGQDDFFADFDDFQTAAPAAAAPAAAPAPAAPLVAGLSSQLDGLSLGGPAPNPSPAPMAAPSPVASPPAAAMPAAMGMRQPMQAAPPSQQGFDPFSGIGSLGSSPPAASSPIAPSGGGMDMGMGMGTGMGMGMPPAASSPMGFAPPQSSPPKRGGGDPFDEFDIFK